MDAPRSLRVCLALLVLSQAGLAPAYGAPPKQTVGWVEKVTLFPGDLILRAKMDSGAKTSSLDARDIQRFSRGGRAWVRFSVTDSRGKTLTFERPEVRTARIKQHNGRLATRPVVMLTLCLGTVAKATQIDLTDRTGFNYRLLAGRRFLAGDFLIDAGATFVRPPVCAADAR